MDSRLRSGCPVSCCNHPQPGPDSSSLPRIAQSLAAWLQPLTWMYGTTTALISLFRPCGWESRQAGSSIRCPGQLGG
jgi:hypothetical protein